MASDGIMPTAVVLNDTSGHKHHGCTLVMQSIFSLAEGCGLRVLATAPVGADWRELPDVAAAMDRADVIIVNGEGTIHHDAPRGEILLLAAQFARRRGAACALINTTWEANSARLAELAGLFDIVSVRESASARELSAAGVACRVVPDLALGSIPPPMGSPVRAGLAFSDNIVTERTVAQYAAMRRLGGQPLNLIYGHRSLRNLAGSLRRYLRAGATIGAASRAVVDDLRSQYPDSRRFLDALSRQSLVVTGRFHMMIMCLATATPFLAVPSNTHKIQAVVEDVGLASWRMPNLASLDRALVARASGWEPGEGEKVAAYVGEAGRLRKALFEDIRRLADGQARSASSIATGGA